MIYPHTSLKYAIIIEATDFDQERDPWHLTIKDKFHRVLADLDKQDCFRDTIGNFYFALPDVPTGKYFALTTAKVPDDDFAEQYATLTDKQDLVDVGLCSCPSHYAPCSAQCETEGIKVTFARVWTKSIDGADYLADKNGQYILTSDGNRIQFISQNDYNNYNNETTMGKVKLNMTGEEFKKLIEGTEPNGHINTLPEALAAMQGISDDGSTIEDSMTSNLTDEDMEKWFDDDPNNDDPEE